jgi:hypothetical protein
VPYTPNRRYLGHMTHHPSVIVRQGINAYAGTPIALVLPKRNLTIESSRANDEDRQCSAGPTWRLPWPCGKTTVLRSPL